MVERLMGLDKNDDGKVTKDEMPERMQERMLERIDTNEDGAIDKKEAEAMAERFQGRGGPPRGARRGVRPGGPGEGAKRPAKPPRPDGE
jgi:collagen type III alpha